MFSALGDHPLAKVRGMVSYARKMSGRRVEFEDVLQAGILGFLEAWKKLEERPVGQQWAYLHRAWHWAMINHVGWAMRQGRKGLDYRVPDLDPEKEVELKRLWDEAEPEQRRAWEQESDQWLTTRGKYPVAGVYRDKRRMKA